MSNDNNDEKPKIVFMPGCFDHLDITQEELDNLTAEIQQMVDSGELFEHAIPLSQLIEEAENDPELAAALAPLLEEPLGDTAPGRVLH